MNKNFLKFKIDLGDRESSGDYKAVNSLGFLGRFQFGKPRLWDLGYSIDGWKPSWWSYKRLSSYKVSIITKQQFLDDPILQDRLFLDHISRLKKVIRRKYSKYYNHWNSVWLSESGLVAGAHLKGLGGVKQFMNGEDNSDAYGTKISEYIEKFAGYDLDNMSS